jgi:prepilin-type N-terminal cleavage/methylation domain-containing protein
MVRPFHAVIGGDVGGQPVALEGDMSQRIGWQRNEEGFTLFELLIVIIILAILAGIVAFSVGSSTANASTSTCQSDAKAVETALEEYKSAVGVFPGDVSLQIPQISPPAVPLTTYGQSWNTPGTLQLPGTFGILGNQASSDGTWTAPNAVVVGPYMRQLPSTQHYQILTDGQGVVFVLPAKGLSTSIPPPRQGATLDNWKVFNANNSSAASSDSNSLNFETNPGICADPNIVS